MNKLGLLLMLTLVAMKSVAQPCRVVGTITDLGSKPVIFGYTQKGVDHNDTVRASGGHFSYVAQPSNDGQISLYISGNQFATFWYEPGQLTVTGNAAEPWKLTITGTPENNVLSAFNHTVQWKDYGKPPKSEADYQALQALQAQDTRQFIQAHPAARTSALQLYWQTKMQPTYPVAEYEKLLQGLKPAVRQSWYGQQAAERVATLRNQPTLGKAVANFSMADTAGIQHSLATYRGKYVLLDFWGHWCHPCIEAMPKVNALHQQYGDKLTIVGVAMESANSAPLWKKAIRQHHVPGLQLSELQADKGPVITGYNVNAFPTYMLLDPQGKLVARANDVEEITKKLAALGSL